MTMKIRITHKCLPACLTAVLFLAGCTAGNTNQAVVFDTDDYPAILPYESSDMRGKHVGLISDIDIRNQVETGLMDLSKSLFPVNEVGYKTHAFLDYDELDATDGSRGLLGTLRDDNPNGLNPGSDEVFDTGNGTVTGPILLSDIYELDFYSNDQLRGISIALVVSDSVTINGERVEINQDKLESYLQVTASKLVSYLRQRFNEVGNSIPILVAAYELNTNESEHSKGGFVYEGIFEGNSGNFTQISQTHLLVPSTDFTAAAPELAAEFVPFRQDVSTILPDNTFVTGEATMENGVCTDLHLTIESHGKTAGEILAVVQSVFGSLNTFTSTDCEYRVSVINNGEVYAMMLRPTHTTDVQIITAY